MVKTAKVGKARPFWRGLLLTIVTFGLYGIYWNFKAHHEVYQQFDLEAEGRDQGIVLFILGIVIPFVGFVLYLIYQWKFVENVNFVRARMGLGEGPSPLEFILWNTLGLLLFIVVGPAIGYYRLQSGINDVWALYDRRIAEMRAPPVPAAMAAPVV